MTATLLIRYRSSAYYACGYPQFRRMDREAMNFIVSIVKHYFYGVGWPDERPMFVRNAGLL